MEVLNKLHVRSRHADARDSHRGEHVRPHARILSASMAATMVPLALVAVQIVGIVTFAVLTIQRFPLWSPIDEAAHFDNVLYVAAHGSLPVQGKTLESEQVLAIGQGVYPRQTTINPRTSGLGGLAYEAFQPPLYYYVVAPVSLLSGNYHTKAILLRYVGLLMLLASIALLARLSRHVLPRQWLLGLSGGLLVFLMPGFVLRMVTISNRNLAVPLAILIVTELWITWKRQSPLRLLLCGFLVGCGVLTDLYLVEMLPVYLLVAGALVWQRKDASTALPAAGGAVLAGAVLLPWLVLNEVRYHALTAATIVKREMFDIVNPHHLHDTVGQLPSITVDRFFQPALPEEWGGATVGHDFYGYVLTLFQVLVVPAAIVLAVALGRRLVTSGLWILALPWVGNILQLWSIFLGPQWGPGMMLPRYTYPTLPLLALFSVAALLSLFSAAKPLLVTFVASTGFLVALWILIVPTIATS